MIRKTARVALWSGSGPGDAFAAGDRKTVSSNQSTGLGDAHKVASNGDASLEGAGSGDARVANDGGGEAIRSGCGTPYGNRQNHRPAPPGTPCASTTASGTRSSIAA